MAPGGGPCCAGRGPPAGGSGWPPRAQRDPCLTASKKVRTFAYNHKEKMIASSSVGLEVGPSPVEPTDENTAWPTGPWSLVTQQSHSWSHVLSEATTHEAIITHQE